MSDSLIPSFLVSNVSESLRSLTKNEQMSESLIFLSESLIRSFFDKNEQFARKSNEQIPSPDSHDTNQHPLKMNILSKTFLQIILAAKWLYRGIQVCPPNSSDNRWLPFSLILILCSMVCLYPKNILYILRERKVPPVVINLDAFPLSVQLLCLLYTQLPVCLYNCQEPTVLHSYTDRGKLSIYGEGGCLPFSKDIYCIFFGCTRTCWCPNCPL